MPEEEEDNTPESKEEEEQEEEQQEEDTRPTHAGCGGKLTPGMEYCPTCGDKVNTDAYE